MIEPIKLTSYSHGAGCGCKISPKILDQILHTEDKILSDPKLLVGNDTRDDAAVYKIDEKRAVISTTDFFMPIVDDPFIFGAIAAVNAISDVYAMAGKPLLAISILGWPVDKLSPEIAGKVIEGARDACRRAGIPLAGGHSIDTPEPIFGLAVTGMVTIENVRTNSSATPGCELYLTKPLGVGIITTAQKKGIVKDTDMESVVNSMLKLNDLGYHLGGIPSVKALTDITGFGLLGHLIELCEGSNLSAEINFEKIPLFENLDFYLSQKSIPGGTIRNFESYGHKIGPMNDRHKNILCDPQTSGGLLVALEPRGKIDFSKMVRANGLDLHPVGKLKKRDKYIVEVK